MKSSCIIKCPSFFALFGMLFFTRVDLKGVDGEQQREGWKTSGNGFFVYKARTAFNNTKQLTINTAFSTTQINKFENMVLAAEDKNGYNLFQYSVSNGQEVKSMLQDGLLQQFLQDVSGITSGELFEVDLIISETVDDDGNYKHTLQSSFKDNHHTTGFTVVEKEAWDLDYITLFIGGYNSSSANYFHGCLSNFVFDGVDIIETYFQEYPNNVNPSRGPLVVGNFSNVPEVCDDIIKSTIVTSVSSHTTEMTPTTSVAFRKEPIKYLNQCFCAFIILMFLNFFSFV